MDIIEMIYYMGSIYLLDNARITNCNFKLKKSSKGIIVLRVKGNNVIIKNCHFGN